MTKKYYRADHRCFQPGDVILPEGSYQDQFETPGKAMEKELEAARPADKKSNRKDCLFVFDDFGEVERYWRTHDGSYVYEVTIDPLKIMHVGDMQLTDLIGGEFRKPIDPPDQDRVTSLSKQYWIGGSSNAPVLEYLVPSATAKEKLKGKSNLKDWVAGQVTKYDPTKDSSIEDMLGIDETDPKPNTNPHND